MIQVVSAYLLIQRGEVTDDNPRHQEVEYIPKSRFKRWLLLDPLNYEKHLFVGFGGGKSYLYGDHTYHRPTLWYDEYYQDKSVVASVRPDSEYTTLDGESSLRELDYRTWGLISNSTFSQMYVDGSGFATSGSDTINNIQYYENSTTTLFPVHEKVSYMRTGSGTIPGPEDVEGDYQHGGFAAEYYERRSGEYGERWAFYSARIVSGVPVFTSYEDGMDYCDKVRAYRENQSSANYQAACDVIDKCINPD